MKKLFLSVLIVTSLNLFGMEPEPQEADQNEKVTLAIASSDLALLEKLSVPVKSWVNFAKAHNKNEVHLPISKEVYDLLVPLLRFKATYGSLVVKPKPEITQRHALLGQYFQTIENAGSLEQLLSDYSSDALIHLLEATHLLELQDLFEKISSQLIMQLQDPETLSEFFKEYLLKDDLRIKLPDYMINQIRRSIKLDSIARYMPVSILHNLHLHDSIQAVAYNPDGKYLAVGTAHTVKIYHVTSGDLIQELEDVGFVMSIAYSPDGKYLAFASKNAISIYNMATAEIKYLNFTEPVMSIAYSHDAKYLAVGMFSGKVFIVDSSTGKTIKALDVIIDSRRQNVLCVAFSPDSQYLAVRAASGIYIYHLTTQSHIETSGLYSMASMPVVYSPDGRYVATTIETSKNIMNINIYDAVTLKIIQNFIVGAFEFTYFTLAYSPDGKYLAVGSDSTLRIYDTATGETIKELQGNQDKIRAVAYNPNYKNLASGSADEKLIIWNLRGDYLTKISKNNSDCAQLLLLNSLVNGRKDNAPFDRMQYPEFSTVFKQIPFNILKVLKDENVLKKY